MKTKTENTQTTEKKPRAKPKVRYVEPEPVEPEPIIPLDPKKVKVLTLEQRKHVRRLLKTCGCGKYIQARISRTFGYPLRLVKKEFNLWLEQNFRVTPD